MRLTDVNKGQVWLLDTPVRIAKVGSPTTIEVTKRTNEGLMELEQKPAVNVEVTMCDQPIKGFVSEHDAKVTGVLKQAILDEPEPTKDTSWQEIWCERVVPEVLAPPGKAAVLNEKKLLGQLFCYKTKGREAKREYTSPCAGQAITGKLIPRELVPKTLFEPLRVSDGMQRQETAAKTA